MNLLQLHHERDGDGGHQPRDEQGENTEGDGAGDRAAEMEDERESDGEERNEDEYADEHARGQSGEAEGRRSEDDPEARAEEEQKEIFLK